ncbi:MAG: hypothetical protein AAGA54_19195 [Myxococcota bacterium]
MFKLRKRAGTASRAAAMVAIGLAAWWIPGSAEASPAVEGTRNVSLGGVSRSSSFGSNAALANPAMMSFSPVFTVEAMYQLNIQSRTNGLGFVVMDSLNNGRIGLGLGYLFMSGSPEITYLSTETGDEATLELSRFGHEAFGALSIVAVPNWVSLGLKPKYQYSSLRYRDTEGLARNAHEKLNAFGLDTALSINFAGFAALSVLGLNVVGNYDPAFTDERDVLLEGLPVSEGSVEYGALPEISDYPLTLVHALSVFPLRSPTLSINFDGTYDFTSFRFEDHVRKTYGGSAEFIAGPVPLRFGTIWDDRGKGTDDDRVYIAGGIAYAKNARPGGMGVDLGFGFQQQVSGPQRETILGFNLGLRLHPDL